MVIGPHVQGRVAVSDETTPGTGGKPIGDKPAGWKDHFRSLYWAVVGVFGIGRPIMDRRLMYGNDPTNDPYSLEYDPKVKRHQ
jgi:hypothetical protein